MIKYELTSRNPMYWIVTPFLLLFGVYSIILYVEGEFFLVGIVGACFTLAGIVCLVGLFRKFTWWSCVSEDSIKWGRGYGGFGDKIEGSLNKKEIKKITLYDNEDLFVQITLNNRQVVSIRQADSMFGNMKKLCNTLTECGYEYDSKNKS